MNPETDFALRAMQGFTNLSSELGTHGILMLAFEGERTPHLEDEWYRRSVAAGFWGCWAHLDPSRRARLVEIAEVASRSVACALDIVRSGKSVAQTLEDMHREIHAGLQP